MVIPQAPTQHNNAVRLCNAAQRNFKLIPCNPHVKISDYTILQPDTPEIYVKRIPGRTVDLSHGGKRIVQTGFVIADSKDADGFLAIDVAENDSDKLLRDLIYLLLRPPGGLKNFTGKDYDNIAIKLRYAFNEWPYWQQQSEWAAKRNAQNQRKHTVFYNGRLNHSRQKFLELFFKVDKLEYYCQNALKCLLCLAVSLLYEVAQGLAATLKADITERLLLNLDRLSVEYPELLENVTLGRSWYGKFVANKTRITLCWGCSHLSQINTLAKLSIVI